MTMAAMRRAADYLARFKNLPEEEQPNLVLAAIGFNRRLQDTYSRFVPFSKFTPNIFVSFFQFDLPAPHAATGDGLLIYTRSPKPKGPLAVFGYDYFEDHAKAAGIAAPKLLSYQGLWGAGEEYAYETLNFADGKRNAQQIRDAVSAEYGPIPLDMVGEYLKALEKIGVVSQAH